MAPFVASGRAVRELQCPGRRIQRRTAHVAQLAAALSLHGDPGHAACPAPVVDRTEVIAITGVAMPLIIETWDKPGHAPIRTRERDVHLAYLEANKSLLLACGARLEDDRSNAGGALYVVDVDTREEAERFIVNDPFALAGLFERLTIIRWRKAYVDGKRDLYDVLRCFLP